MFQDQFLTLLSSVFFMTVCAGISLCISCRVLFHNKTDILEEIDARVNAADDSPPFKTPNKVCYSKDSVQKCAWRLLNDITYLFFQH